MKWKTASLIAIVICLAVGLMLWLDDSSKQTFQDGTVLVLSGVKIGRTNPFSFTVLWPLTGTMQTNLGGFQVHIHSGNAQWLGVELMNKQAETRLTFVKAVDDAGNDLDNWSGSWGQHSFWKSLKSSNSVRVHATVAIHPNYPVGFTLMPRYEQAPERLEPNRGQPASQ